jgi:hypothetical protein
MTIAEYDLSAPPPLIQIMPKSQPHKLLSRSVRTGLDFLMLNASNLK